ncbi:MAG: hypothetical protein ABL998_09720 [Planctomycetota bacterium]
MPQEVCYGEFILHAGVTWHELDLPALDRFQAAGGTHDAQDIEHPILEATLWRVGEDQIGAARLDPLPVNLLALDARAGPQVDL